MHLIPLKLVFCNTSNFEPITKIFKDSLYPLISQNKITLFEQIVDVSKFDKFGPLTSSWRHAIIVKLKHTLAVLENNTKENEYIVVCDTDIKFYNCVELLHLIETAKNNNLDFYGVREDYKHKRNCFNGGFYILRNNSNVRAFYKEFIKAVESLTYRLVDQELLSKMITNKNFNIKYDFIPQKFVTLGKVGKRSNPTNSTIFHHAMGGSTIIDKLNQLQRAKFRYSAAHM